MCLKKLLNVRLQGLQNSKSNHFFYASGCSIVTRMIRFSKVIVEVIDETCEVDFELKTKSSINVLVKCSVYGLRFCPAHNYIEERLRVKNCFFTYFPEVCQFFISNNLVTVEPR